MHSTPGTQQGKREGVLNNRHVVSLTMTVQRGVMEMDGPSVVQGSMHAVIQVLTQYIHCLSILLRHTP